MPPFDKQENEWFQEELYPHEPMLKAWLASRFPGISDFEDVIQEAYIRTVKRQRKKHLTAPKAFLFAIARNLCIDSLRRGKVVRFESLGETDFQMLSDRSKGIPDRVMDKEEYEILTRAIQALPKKCRRIFTLRKVYGLSLKQIADELNISIKTVEAKLFFDKMVAKVKDWLCSPLKRALTVLDARQRVRLMVGDGGLNFFLNKTGPKSAGFCRAGNRLSPILY